MVRKKQRPANPEGAAAEPRHKKREKRSSGSGPLIEMGPHEMSIGVPVNVKIAIASEINDNKEMDASLEAFIWDMSGLSYDDGKLLTKVETSEKIVIAKALAERYGVPVPKVPANTPSMWRILQDLGELRNRIAHSVWGMHRLQTPLVSSFRMKGDPDRMISESFPIVRLEAMSRQCERLKGVST